MKSDDISDDPCDNFVIQMSSDVITIVTVIINYVDIKICYYTLEKFSLCSVTSEMEKDLRTANGPVRHLQFLRNFKKSFRIFKALCLDYFVFPFLKNNVFKNRPGTISELMQVISDNCNLIDVLTLRRSFENMKPRITLCLKAEGRYSEHLL
jgi:hypothetical protein